MTEFQPMPTQPKGHPMTPAFLPTGEVPRKPRMGEHYRDDFSCILFAYNDIQCGPMPIYRAVPADSVIVLTPEVRCELAFARMWKTWMKHQTDFDVNEVPFLKMCERYANEKPTLDLADAMQRLTKEMEGAT